MEPVELIEHKDTAWVRKVAVTIDGKEYRVTFGWAEDYGYDLMFTSKEVMDWAKDNNLRAGDLCQKLDDLTFEQVK
jgi:hypothetical protein